MEENMKEYKTLQVSPEKEGETITECSTFGWQLEDTREVYNETQEILGVDEKVTAYGSFMRGFTGNDGKVESRVRTRTNITHYLSMRFSRDTSMKRYSRLVQLENEFYNPPAEPEYLPLKELKLLRQPVHLKKPIGGTVMNVIVLIAAIVAVAYLLINESTRTVGWAIAVDVIALVVAAIWTITIACSWKRYVRIHPNEDTINAEIEKENEAAAKENEIIELENKQIEKQNEMIKHEFETRESLLKEVCEILAENGIEI
jgi:hypothetical protein